VPLEASLIGPPLAVTLAQGERPRRDRRRGSARAVSSRRSKQDYDSEGYRTTEVFPGVAEGPGAARRRPAHRLYIVTNKRMVPTRRILEALGLARHFAGIHTRDETAPPAPSKAAVTAAPPRPLRHRPGTRLSSSATPTRTPPPRARTASPSSTPPTATARRASRRDLLRSSPAGMRCFGICNELPRPDRRACRAGHAPSPGAHEHHHAQSLRHRRRPRPQPLALLGQLVKRDVLLRYRGAMFGVLWIFLSPLLMLAILCLRLRPHIPNALARSG
jgi:hypothetical protein